MKRIIISIIPLIVLAACSSPAEKSTQSKAATAPAYQLVTVEQGGISSIVKLPAQLAAYQEVSIFPKVNSYVKTVLVDIGSKVQQGQPLMTLEAPELLQAAIQAKERFAKSRSAYAIDKEHYNRLLEAAATAGAISPLDLSTARENMQADSAQANAEKANWEMQEAMMGYLQVTAPFAGVITERNVHPGALVNASGKDKPMLELKQTAHLRLQVDVPEAVSATIKNGDTISFTLNAQNGRVMVAQVVRKADNISEQYRNERVEADIPNVDGLLSPGMYAEVMLHAKGGGQVWRVPKTAVVTSTERKYVLKVKNSVITKVDVTTGNESASSIEVYGVLQSGDTVIANASDEIKEGHI